MTRLKQFYPQSQLKLFIKDEKEIVEYNIIGSRDTIWYNGIKANAIISNYNQGDRADTIIITRSYWLSNFIYQTSKNI